MNFDTFVTELENKARNNTDLSIAYSNVLLKLINIKNIIGFEETKDPILEKVNDVVLNDFKSIIDCRIRFCYNRIDSLTNKEDKDADNKIRKLDTVSSDKSSIKVSTNKLSFGFSSKKE